MTSFHCFNTYVLRDNILDVTERRCARKKKKKKKKKKARGDTTCLPQIPPEKNNETGNIWLWPVYYCLLATCCFHRPLTSGPRDDIVGGLCTEDSEDYGPRDMGTIGRVQWRLWTEDNTDYRPKVLRTIGTTDQRFYGLYGLQTKGFTDYTDYRPKVLRTIRTTDQRLYGLYGLQTKGFTDCGPRTIRTTDQRFYGLYGRTTHNFH